MDVPRAVLLLLPPMAEWCLSWWWCPSRSAARIVRACIRNLDEVSQCAHVAKRGTEALRVLVGLSAFVNRVLDSCSPQGPGAPRLRTPPIIPRIIREHK